MEIRQAYQNEAQEIAPLVHEAVGDIADELANSQDKRKVRDLLANLIKREGTRVGHTFIDVVKVNGVIGGIAVSYSGKVLEAANKPTFGFCADTMTVLLRQYKKTYFLCYKQRKRKKTSII